MCAVQSNHYKTNITMIFMPVMTVCKPVSTTVYTVCILHAHIDACSDCTASANADMLCKCRAEVA